MTALRSMTGFAEASREGERHRITVTVRSVNHRFLDLLVRLPEPLRAAEPELRRLLAAHLARGRVELRVEAGVVDAGDLRLEVHEDAIRAVAGVAERLAAAGVIRGALTVGDLLRLPEVIELRREDPGWAAAENELLQEAAAAALRELIAAREAEGAHLAAALAGRLGELEAFRAELDARRDSVREQLVEGLRRRLRELVAEPGIPEERLAVEAALLAERSDVREELDRLRAHLARFREVLAEGGAVGRRLDFLTQEIHRELNTLGAKCRDGEMAERVIDAKVACEQLREQVQNVE